jgi:hypothetical protein
LPGMRFEHEPEDSKTWKSRRQSILGMQQVSNLSRHKEYPIDGRDAFYENCKTANPNLIRIGSGYDLR